MNITNPSINEVLNRLRHAARILYSEKLHYAELQNAVLQWKNAMIALHDINLEHPQLNENMLLPEGKALATRWAAWCMDDVLRTKKFALGIKKAVDLVLKANPKKPVKILYAGTGPFATLVLPLTTHYTAAQLQLDLIEVNPKSFEYLKQTIQKLQLQDYVCSLSQADATTYQVENASVDILVVECLQHTLAREPQVKIVQNLIPQLPPDVILIPEEISLQLMLVNSEEQRQVQMGLNTPESACFWHKKATVFSLTKANILENDSLFDEYHFNFDQAELEGRNRLSVFTEMHIFDDQFLGFNESGLTLPWVVTEWEGATDFKRVTTQYLTGNDPHLAVKIIKAHD